jgi:hypothetical protein
VAALNLGATGTSRLACAETKLSATFLI